MSDAIDRLRPALADRYTLERELGQGGMATVYLAQDRKHDRKVAIKVLRAELAAVIGAERFLREIKTIANLQHPHILGLIDSGEALVEGQGSRVEGQPSKFVYYVMPFVEGESLRDRLTREKQLPIADAVRLASEVAAALDYAHRHGVIHRDIKPENVLLHDGSALVADFGIALAVSTAGSTRMTETGMSLGTPHYMSPEQAMGEREITARSDVYALGAMTYEMLVGEPPFTGPTAQAIIAKVMTGEPASLTGQRKSVPPAVEDAVLTALSKLPADRFGSAAEFAEALNGRPGAATVSRRAVTTPASRRTLGIVSTIATLAVLAAAALAVKVWRPAPLPVTRLTLDLPDLRVNHTGYYGAAFAIARDGSRIAFISRIGGGGVGLGGITHLMVRDRWDLQPRPIGGTDGADGPFFSPDGQWIGYIADGKVYKVAAAGGAQPVQLADGANPILAGGAWLEDGRVVFSSPSFALMAVPSTGGATTMLVRPPDNGGMIFPTALPRKDVLLVTRCGNNCAQQVLMAANLKTQALDTILRGASRAFYLPNGFLVAALQDGSVVGAPFDVGALKFKRAPTALLSGVQSELTIIPEIAVADDGTMLYLPSSQTAGRATPAEVDRSGKGRVLDPSWLGRFNSMTLSPDGRQVAVSIAEGTGGMLWVKQLDAGPLTRVTFDGTINYRGTWMADGRTLSFSSDMHGPQTHLFRVRADGSDKPEQLFPTDTSQIDEAAWSQDGQWVAYRTGTIAGVRDLYARRLQGDTTRLTIAAGPADEYMPAFSPDGKWIAYVSLESGREEVYVRPFPDVTRARWQVSPSGGTSPVWAHSGRELFYLAPGDSLVSAAVTGTPDFQVISRRALFSTLPYVFQPWHQAFGVRPGDRTFVMLQRSSSQGPETRRLTVVLNWFTEIQAKQNQAP
ncbi:MAG TPA: protein kinase [Gemmatimonadales bacterium]|nr:protein kinase [Gemmatimonadales bacterium]